MVYEPRARVHHALDVSGLKFIRKHFDRGFDSVSVYRCDERAVLRGTPFVRRFGILAFPPLTARRILLDCTCLVRNRRQIGIPLIGVAYWGVVAIVTRSIELAGAIWAFTTSRTREA